MPIQRSRFHAAIQSPPQQQVRTAIVEPVLGLNVSRPALNLRPGETPYSQNWVSGDRYIEPRSGLSLFNSADTAETLLSDTPLYAAFVPERVGTDVAYIVSQNTIIQHAPGDSTSSWTLVHGDTPDSTSTKALDTFFDGFYDHSIVFDATDNLQYLVLSNWNSLPLKVPVQSSAGASASIISSFASNTSFARYTEAIDDRLMFFSSRDSGGVPDQYRVWWSARGDPMEFTDGAGFEDLEGMQGIPSGLARSNERLAIYSTRELWLGNPRRDAHAFDFFRISGIGNEHPHSLQNTAVGPIWLGPENEFYRLVDTSPRRIGAEVKQLLDDELREAQTLFSHYEPATGIYAFYYSDTTGEYPTRALYLRTNSLQPAGVDVDRGAWFLQDFGSRELTAASRVNATLAPQQAQDIFVVSSVGTPYRFLSTQTTDDGTAIDARWRSHLLRSDKDPMAHEALQEVWVATAPSASTHTMGVHVTEDEGATFRDIGDMSFSSTTETGFLPVEPRAARHTQFELRVDDGSKPRVGYIQLTLRSYTGRHRG